MKLKQIIAVFLVLCMSISLTACLPANVSPTETQTPTTTTVPTTTIPPTTTVPGPKTLHLKDYVTGIDTSKIDDDTIITLLRQAEAILQEYDVVIIEDIFEIKHYSRRLRFSKNGVTSDFKGSLPGDSACLVTIHTDSIDAEYYRSIHFMVMGALLLQEYHDCYYNYNSDYWDGPRSDPYYAPVYIFPSFEESEYNTLQELYDATRYKEYSVGEAGAYFVDFTDDLGLYTSSQHVYPVFVSEWETMDQKDCEQHYTNLMTRAFPEE